MRGRDRRLHANADACDLLPVRVDMLDPEQVRHRKREHFKGSH
jgi:hypothetical protein